jgi:hypothetical protein
VSWLPDKVRQLTAIEEGLPNNRTAVITDAAFTHDISPWCRGEVVLKETLKQ